MALGSPTSSFIIDLLYLYSWKGEGIGAGKPQRRLFCGFLYLSM
jgi:hypothetical protein